MSSFSWLGQNLCPLRIDWRELPIIKENKPYYVLVTIPGCILVGWELINGGGVAALFAHVVMLDVGWGL